MKIRQGASKVSNDKQVTPRTVFILGGKDVRSPSHHEDLRATTTHKNRRCSINASMRKIENPHHKEFSLTAEYLRRITLYIYIYIYNRGEHYIIYNSTYNHGVLQW